MSGLLPAITGGLVRAIIPFAAAKGIDLDNEQAEQIVQGLVVLATVAWSAWQKLRQRDKVEKAAVTGVVPA